MYVIRDRETGNTIIICPLYEQAVSLVTEFEKQEGNAFQKNFGKMYLNSLYGKMGSKIINPVMKLTIDDKGLLKYVEIGCTQNQSLYVPLAVFIIAYGRIKLVKVINQNFDLFCYCDTDSFYEIVEVSENED